MSSGQGFADVFGCRSTLVTPYAPNLLVELVRCNGCPILAPELIQLNQPCIILFFYKPRHSVRHRNITPKKLDRYLHHLCLHFGYCECLHCDRCRIHTSIDCGCGSSSTAAGICEFLAGHSIQALGKSMLGSLKSQLWTFSKHFFTVNTYSWFSFCIVSYLFI